MTEQEAFLQAIIEEPDDDTPRLVYADWLDEHGEDDRAEFIRVQCLQASLPWDDDRQSELLAREARLLARHYEEWTAVCGGWPDRESDGSPGIGFRRGFIEHLRHAQLDYFLEWAHAIFAACPVRHLQMQLTPGMPLPPGRAFDLARCAYLERLRTLQLWGGRQADVLEVCWSPHLDRLETLVLWANSLTDEGLRELVALPGLGPPPGLRSLRCLGIGYNGLTADALAALAASPLARTVTGLDFTYNSEITVEGLGLLVSSPWWRRLEELNVGRCFPNVPGAGRLLAEGLGRARLRALRVDSNLYGLEDNESLVGALAAAPTWGPLRALSLRECRLDGGRLRILLDCPHAAGLTLLGLYDCGLEDADIELLADCPRLCGLTALWLGNNRISNRGAAALAESPYLNRLRRLHLQGTAVTDAGIAALARSPNVERLTHLAIGPGHTEAAVEALAASPRLDHLYALKLGGWFNNAGALTLARSPFLRCLTHVRIDESRVSETGKRALRQATHGVWGSRGVEERSEPFFSWEA
jgi:uncharacterized protein (TIGR02996 family)